MYNTINNEDDARNQKLNEELYLKYSLQEIDSDILVKKYQYASKSMKKIIHTIFKERGFQVAKYMLNSDSSFIDFLIIDFQFRIQFTVSFGF